LENNEAETVTGRPVLVVTADAVMLNCVRAEKPAGVGSVFSITEIFVPD